MSTSDSNPNERIPSVNIDNPNKTVDSEPVILPLPGSYNAGFNSAKPPGAQVEDIRTWQIPNDANPFSKSNPSQVKSPYNPGQVPQNNPGPTPIYMLPNFPGQMPPGVPPFNPAQMSPGVPPLNPTQMPQMIPPFNPGSQPMPSQNNKGIADVPVQPRGTILVVHSAPQTYNGYISDGHQWISCKIPENLPSELWVNIPVGSSQFYNPLTPPPQAMPVPPPPQRVIPVQPPQHVIPVPPQQHVIPVPQPVYDPNNNQIDQLNKKIEDMIKKQVALDQVEKQIENELYDANKQNAAKLEIARQERDAFRQQLEENKQELATFDQNLKQEIHKVEVEITKKMQDSQREQAEFRESIRQILDNIVKNNISNRNADAKEIGAKFQAITDLIQVYENRFSQLEKNQINKEEFEDRFKQVIEQYNKTNQTNSIPFQQIYAICEFEVYKYERVRAARQNYSAMFPNFTRTYKRKSNGEYIDEKALTAFLTKEAIPKNNILFLFAEILYVDGLLLGIDHWEMQDIRMLYDNYMRVNTSESTTDEYKTSVQQVKFKALIEAYNCLSQCIQQTKTQQSNKLSTRISGRKKVSKM